MHDVHDIGLLRENQLVEIGLRFRGQPDHDIEFKMKDTCGYKTLRSNEEIFGAQSFIDKNPQPLRTSVRGDGHAAEPGGSQEIEHLIGDAIRPER